MEKRCRVLVVSKIRLSAESLCASLSSLSERYEAVHTSCLTGYQVPRDFEPDVILEMCLDDCPAGTRSTIALFPNAKCLVIARAPAHAQQADWLEAGVSGIIDEADEASGLGELDRAITAVLSGHVWAPRRLISELVLGKNRAPERKSRKELTRREAQLLALLRLGLSNRQIGLRLFISEKTVKAHLTKIYRKLGVENRLQASLKAGEQREMNRKSAILKLVPTAPLAQVKKPSGQL